jgi:NADH:ubiquinone oxidoreductase subunit 5 (subunit L)/multisubunit Na+/H+ antiporter MnhA subunit
MINLIPYILLLPLAGFVVLGLFGRSLPRGLISLIGCGTVAVAFVLAVVQFVAMLGLAPSDRTSDLNLYTWLASGSQTCSGSWADLAAAATKSSSAMAVSVAPAGWMASGAGQNGPAMQL